MKKYDIIFIGGGPGGYSGAIRASQLGFKTLVVEKHKLGGACLHLGCIPTKAMLASASLIDKINRAVQFGLEVRLDHPHKLWKIAEKKDEIVETLESGLSQTLKKKGVETLYGEASFENPHTLSIKTQAGEEKVEAGTIVIATGSRPQELSILPFNGTQVLSSDHLLSLREAPKRLGIIGGGVVGCEFASLFASLGTQVFIVEMMPHILPMVDRDIAARLEVFFKRRGIQVFAERKIEKLSTPADDLNFVLSGGEKFSCEKVLVAIGRRRNIENLGLEKIGVKTEKGIIQVNEYLETSQKGVFAVGDVIASPQLAHVAQAEAVHVVENLKRNPIPMDYTGWPNTIFTHPEVAATGLTKEESEKQGKKVEEVRYLYGSLGKSHVEREPEGLVKLVFDQNSQQLLGGHIIGDRASELIAELSLALRLRATRQDLAATIHAHPTFSEIIWEASRNI